MRWIIASRAILTDMSGEGRERQRFTVGAKVWVKNPGVHGVVTLCGEKPAALGEYWHTTETEHGERKEPGCNLELVPIPMTDSRTEAMPRTEDRHNLIAGADSAPRVFISYSWDSEEHKEWVRSLALSLRNTGIDAVIDQTHLSLGARNPEFMERSVRESARVLVVCTEKYKRRFDRREGGAGYEGHIITGEIISEVGQSKFVPVLRSGDWQNALPTALSGINGVDLRCDSPTEHKRLLKDLHGISDVSPVGKRPEWLSRVPSRPESLVIATSSTGPDPNEYWQQRKGLPDTEILRKVWAAKPRWRIWIRSQQFRKSRFQNLEQCRDFMLSEYVRVQGWFPYPRFSPESIESGEEWVAGEIDQTGRLERWALFRSGQFVHNRAFDEMPQLGNRTHVLEILDTITGAFELAARMGQRGVLSPQAVLTFELYSVDGRALSWPADIFGDAIGGNGWCQEENLSVQRTITIDELDARRRELALDVTLEICSKFGWADPPNERLAAAQGRRFGAVQRTEN